jgi:integrase
MPRARKDSPIDLTSPHDLSLGLIERLTCPPGKEQVFLRAASVEGLRVRCTAKGAKSWVFESKVKGRTFRRTLGPVGVMSIPRAEDEARALALVVKTQKADPRELERQEAQEAATQRAAQEAEAVREAGEQVRQRLTVREAWEAYLVERRPYWRERTFSDHQEMTQAAGLPRKRSKELTKAGPLVSLMGLRLLDLTPEAVRLWAEQEAPERAARVRLGLRLLKAFLRWAAQEPAYKGLVDAGAASGKKARDAAGKPGRRDDVLQREQLKAWFGVVRAMQNRTIGAYLQALLLLGCRKEELLALRWDDVSFEWNTLHLSDKVADEGRVVPLPPYVKALLQGLPRRSAWVFASLRAVDPGDKNRARRERYHARRGQDAPLGDVAEASASGRIADPGKAHRRACAAAGIEALSLHGLRRSFASLSEWVETPAGVAAQIQGHAASGVREKHYIRRPLDLLRIHHERIEAWVLRQAGVQFAPAPSVPRLVTHV